MKNFFASLKGMGVLGLMLCWGVGFGQPGFLDPSFGNGGKVLAPIDSFSLLAAEMRIQPDGKIVAVGTTQYSGPFSGGLISGFVVVRFNADGSLDNTFGSGGKVINHFSNDFEECQTLNIQPDGKIIVGGAKTMAGSSPDAVLVRYNNDGTIDSSFGNNGSLVEDFGNNDLTYRTLLKPDGKIITAGQHSGFIQALLIQYTSAGVRDSSFGSNGVALSPFYAGITGYFPIDGLALQSDGKILAGGFSGQFEAVRFLPDGKIDSSYGDTGRARINLAGSANYLTLQQDGKAILSGTIRLNNHFQIALVRVHTNGLLDSTFGTNGIVITDLDTANHSGWQSFVQPDGKILVAGTNSTGSAVPNNPPNGYRGDFVLLRYNSDGTLDNTFGVQGMITTDFGLQDNAFSLTVQSDGKVIVGGRSSDSSKYSMGLVRYNFNALPLHLLTFTAKKANTANLLNWTTAQEVNTDRFDIERSPNSREFSKIGSVKANSINGQYNYTDNQTGNEKQETVFYRLKMLDKDGQFTYSPIRQLNIQHSTLNIALFPNPAKDNLQLQIESDQKTTMQLQVLAQDGKVALTQQLTAPQGSSMQSINISQLAAGHYFLKGLSPNQEPVVVGFEKVR